MFDWHYRYFLKKQRGVDSMIADLEFKRYKTKELREMRRESYDVIKAKIKNLEELANVLPEISDDTFQHHVNNEKNDFSNWIRDVVGDQQLANDLLSSKSKYSALNKIRNRLNSLKNKAG